MNDWSTHVLEDLAYVVRVRLGDNDVEVEAYETVAAGESLFTMSDGSMTEDIAKAGRYLHGSIRWDGCANVLFDHNASNHMLHFCGPGDAMDLSRLLVRLYTMARGLMPNHDWKESEERAK